MSVLERNNVTVSGGGAQPMLFAHGYGCDQHMWRLVAPAFAETHRLVLFDHVGSGRSDLAAYDRTKYSSLQGYARYLESNLYQSITSLYELLLALNHSMGWLVSSVYLKLGKQ